MGKSNQTRGKSYFEKWQDNEMPFPGSFDLALFQAYQKASGDNQKRLKVAFPKHFMALEEKEEYGVSIILRAMGANFEILGEKPVIPVGINFRLWSHSSITDGVAGAHLLELFKNWRELTTEILNYVEQNYPGIYVDTGE